MTPDELAGISPPLPTSLGQRLMWMMENHRGAEGTLSSHILFRVRGRLNVEALQQAFAKVCDRHESLRTTFVRQQGLLHRRVHPHLLPDVRLLESVGTDDTAIAGAIRKELKNPFDLESSCCRLAVLPLSDQEYVLAGILHHLVTDGWSAQIIAEDLSSAYNAVVGGTSEPLEPAVPYSEFIEWERRRLDQRGLAVTQRAWEEMLSGLELPRLEPSPPVGGGAHATAIIKSFVEPQLASALQGIGVAARATQFVVLLTAFYVLLHRRTGQRDLTVASFVANRSKRFSGTVGFFANMVLLRQKFGEASTFSDLLIEVKRTSLFVLLHQEISFHLLPRHVLANIEGRPENIVFQMLAEPTANLALDGLQTEPLGTMDGLGSRWDLEVICQRLDTGAIELVFRRTDDVYSLEWIEDFAADYLNILQEVVDDVSSRLEGIGS